MSRIYWLLLWSLLIGILGESGGLVEGKQFNRCELTLELLQKYQISKTFLSNWICLIEHESNRDTRKLTRKNNESFNHGLFQISSKYGCRNDRKGGLCNQKCEDFLDDKIDDDVECAKKIYDREGFKHWQGWQQYCRNQQNLPNLGIVCNIRGISRYQMNDLY